MSYIPVLYYVGVVVLGVSVGFIAMSSLAFKETSKHKNENVPSDGVNRPLHKYFQKMLVATMGVLVGLQFMGHQQKIEVPNTKHTILSEPSTGNSRQRPITRPSRGDLQTSGSSRN